MTLTSSTQTVITDVQVLENGSLVSKMPSGTTLNSFWDFDIATGIGPFGSYYAAINLASGSNADDTTEARLSANKGEIAYILDPNNLHQTIGGTTFTPSLYNVMLIIPTVYWYSDTATGKLYVGNSADTFSDLGISMTPYAHTYTIDPDVDTGNPAQEVSYASVSLVMGTDSIVRLYANGDVKLISSDSTTVLGTVSSGSDVTFSISDDTLDYGTGTKSDMLAYVSSEGEMVYAHNPIVTGDSRVIIGGVTENLETTTGTVTIGYCVDSTYDSITDATVNVLDPVSTSGGTYTSTEITVNDTEIDSGVYRVDSILFTSEWSDSESVATYTYFLAPAEVVTETQSGDIGALGTIISVIPIIMIVGMMMFAIGLWKYRT